jgi:hypothetical protein
MTRMEELHMRMARVEDECAAEAVELSRLVIEISNALVYMGVFPIRDIPWHPKSAQDVLVTTSLVLECL